MTSAVPLMTTAFLVSCSGLFGCGTSLPVTPDTTRERPSGAVVLTKASDLFRRLDLEVFVALTIGIVGLPNVGKSTLFNALTKNDVIAANYPFATIEPNVGVVGVPDARLPVLAEMFDSARVLPATVSFELGRASCRERVCLTARAL